MSLSSQLRFQVLPDIPMIESGNDLADILLAALARAPVVLGDGDVLVVAQKIVSKAEGRLVRLDTVTASPRAVELAMDRILLPQLDIRHRPCNFVELLPRIRGT